MDDFVKQKLRDWNLEKFIGRFKKAGIDEEIFNELNDEMLEKLFNEDDCGFKKKFMLRFQSWKSDPYPKSQYVINLSDLPIDVLMESSSSFDDVNEASDPLITNVRSLEAPKFVSATSSSGQKSALEMLRSTTKGKIAEQMFLLKQKIDTRIISDVIIEYEFTNTGSYSIKGERFEELAAQLGAIFLLPNSTLHQSIRRFYFPYTKATKLRKSFNAGGVLYEKYLKYRRTLHACKLISKKDVAKDELPTASDESDVDWLPDKVHHEQEVVEKWKETFDQRGRCTNATQYLSKFKCLQSNIGHILISNDFDIIFETAKDNLRTVLASVSSAIVTFARKKNKISDSDEALIAAGKIDVLALLCLPRLLGVIVRKRKNDGTFGTVQDVINTFIANFKTHKEFISYKEIRQKKEGDVGPYVAYIGDAKDEGGPAAQTFIVLYDNIYKIQSGSIVEAVDQCYKAFFALNIAFTAECRHVWCFLQAFIYKNSLEDLKCYTVVNKLIDELGKLL